MVIILNGEDKTISPETNVSQLLESLKIEANGIAIGLNNTILPFSKWRDTILNENDSLIIITASQGG